jgi:flagellar hook-length control protein FliK
MNNLTITPAQPTVVAPSDSSSTAAGSESDFGPILQAAAIPPAPPPDPKGTASSSRTQPQAGKDDTATTADPASAKSDRTAVRRSSRDSAGAAQRTEADAAAAASAVAGIVAPRVEAAPAAEASAASRSAAGNGSDAASDQTHPGSAVAKATASNPLPAGQAPIQAPSIGAEALALRTPIGSDRPAAAQPSTQLSKLAADAIQSDPAGAGPARTSIRSEDVRSDDSGDHDSEDDGGADAQLDSAFTAAVAPGSALSSGSAAQAVAHALSVQIQQATPQTADSAPAHANNAPALITPTDVASTAAASAGGAFGTPTSYPPEGRASVATPVGQPGFGQEFSERVVVLARGGVQTAQISLEPAGLGPVGVSIQVHGQAASLVFTAQHETTRNALEAELPRLREMFAANGMQLSDASVGGRAQSQWSAPDQARSSSQPPAEGAADPVTGATAEAVTTARARAVQRLVDTYA